MRYPYRYRCPKCGARAQSDVAISEGSCSHGKPVTRYNPATPLVKDEDKL